MSLMVFNLLIILPFYVLSIRRLHDIGKSGWWILIPLIGLYFLILPSDEENEYGSPQEDC